MASTIIAFAQKGQHIGVEPFRILQEGEMADIRLHDEPGIGDCSGHEPRILEFDRLVMVAIDDPNRQVDRAQGLRGEIGLGRPHVVDVVEKGIIAARCWREFGIFAPRPSDEPVENGALARVFQATRIAIGGKGEEAAQPLGMMNGDIKAENGTVAPADDRRPLDGQKIHEPENISRHEIIAERPCVAAGASVAATVHEYDTVMLGEHRHLVAPVGGIGEAAMQKDDGRALAEFRIPDFNAIDRCKPAMERMRQNGRRR